LLEEFYHPHHLEEGASGHTGKVSAGTKPYRSTTDLVFRKVISLVGFYCLAKLRPAAKFYSGQTLMRASCCLNSQDTSNFTKVEYQKTPELAAIRLGKC